MRFALIVEINMLNKFKLNDWAFPQSYMVWDLETTGLDPFSCDIVEFACLMVENGQVVNRYSSLINWETSIPKEASDIHGITTEMVQKDGLPAETALNTIYMLFAKYKHHVTHNGIRFDIPFLLNAFNKVGTFTKEHLDALEIRLVNNAIDTAVIIKGQKIDLKRLYNETFWSYGQRVMEAKVAGIKFNVGSVCDELGIDRTGITQHRAEGDVELTAQIFKSIIS
jgi:DNA polymerase III epsilon subunit-like protein